MKAKLTAVTVVLGMAVLVLLTGCTVMNSPPTASFTCNPPSGGAPLSVSFNASGSYDSDGSIVSYQWSFGDGSSGTGVETSHTYQNPGNFVARLTVTDNKGARDSATRTISVAAPPPEPLLFTGRGKQVSPLFSLTQGLVIFRMTHNGSSNFIIVLLDDHGDWVELLVNEIGSFDGAKAVGVESTGTYLLDIQADGDWTVTIEQPNPISAPAIPRAYTGVGQQVSPFFTLASGLAIFRMEHTGSSNFIIVLLDSQGQWVDLLVNEIGSFSGSKAVGIDDSGIYLLDICADGNWEVSIEQ